MLVLLSAYLLGIQQSYWVLFGAITITKLHAGVSFHRGKQRVYGTIVGVAISVLLAAWLLHEPWGLGLIIPLCIFGAVYYFIEYAVCIVFITILFVLTIAISTHEPIYDGLARIFDTFLGVSLAVIVISYLWPSHATKAVERDFQSYFSQVQALFLSFTQAFLGTGVSLEEKNKKMKSLEEIYLRIKENIAFVEYECDKKINFQEKTKNIFLKLSCLYSALNTLGSLATANVTIVSGGELHQHLVIFIDKIQNNSSVILLNEIQKMVDYLQHTAIKLEQEQQWIIGAFIQTVCDVTDEIKCVRQASHHFY